jgi:hypothetical protein
LSTNREGTARLCALHALSQCTAIVGFLSLLGPWIIDLVLIPLHIYFAVHNTRALGAGRWAAAGLGVVATIPLANTLLLIALNQRLSKLLDQAGVKRGFWGYWRNPRPLQAG